MEKGKTNHHRIPKSRAKEGFDVHHPDNQGLVHYKLHESVHRLFHNKLPHEQILFLLELNSKVIERRTIKEIKRVIEEGDFYRRHLLKSLEK